MIFPRDSKLENEDRIFRTIQSVPAKDEVLSRKNQLQSNFWASSIFILLFAFAALSVLNMQSEKKPRSKSLDKN